MECTERVVRAEYKEGTDYDVWTAVVESTVLDDVDRANGENRVECMDRTLNVNRAVFVDRTISGNR